ncbi:MAG TPA: acyl-CoA dehydrogenase family protein [Streptosporangiaceae bacterium]
MRFALTDEQRQFGAAVHDLLSDADVPGAARAWAAGDHAPGVAIWRALAKSGVTGLAVPESCGGLGAHPVDLVVACEELGRHPVPGPVAESIAAVPALLAALPASKTEGQIREWLTGLADGDLIGSIALPPAVPYALDGDMAGLVLHADLDQDEAAMTIRQAAAGVRYESADRARRLVRAEPGQPVATGPAAAAAARRTVSYGTLASAALLLGAGRGMLEATTRHAKTREQFGRPIGSFQAVKHALADVLIGLEFARPLLYAAAIALGASAPTAARDISAARVACADAAQGAARVALQVHGAIGYTLECDVSLWLAKVRSLSSNWGSQAEHRAAVLTALTSHALTGEQTGAWS